jgi:hypothetical protein
VLDHRLHLGQFGVGGREQRGALVGAQFRERRIAAGDQAFARVVGVGELEQVALVEQPQLQRAAAGDG